MSANKRQKTHDTECKAVEAKNVSPPSRRVTMNGLLAFLVHHQLEVRWRDLLKEGRHLLLGWHYAYFVCMRKWLDKHDPTHGVWQKLMHDGSPEIRNLCNKLFDEKLSRVFDEVCSHPWVGSDTRETWNRFILAVTNTIYMFSYRTTACFKTVDFNNFNSKLVYVGPSMPSPDSLREHTFFTKGIISAPMIIESLPEGEANALVYFSGDRRKPCYMVHENNHLVWANVPHHVQYEDDFCTWHDVAHYVCQKQPSIYQYFLTVHIPDVLADIVGKYAAEPANSPLNAQHELHYYLWGKHAERTQKLHQAAKPE